MAADLTKLRKIIHVDMDCFYAAVEIRDNPSLAGKPVAVGGAQEKRGVICTCNYIARKYGIHSAMPTAIAYRHCRELILLPVNMAKYRAISNDIQKIFLQYTDLVEPLALDEAYLDVTHSHHYNGSATLIAKAICSNIWQSQQLTASAGVAPNKLLAKIASGWHKPNGMLVILPTDIDNFMRHLAVEKLYGVGKVTAAKLKNRNLHTCADLQKISLSTLVHSFGKTGKHLYDQCRGIDHREVKPNSVRKSLSVEKTFAEDLKTLQNCATIVTELHQHLIERIKRSAPNLAIKNQYVKIKFHDFKQTTTETASNQPELKVYQDLLKKIYSQQQKPIRLLGLGVTFKVKEQSTQTIQMSLFETEK